VDLIATITWVNVRDVLVGGLNIRIRNRDFRAIETFGRHCLFHG